MYSLYIVSILSCDEISSNVLVEGKCSAVEVDGNKLSEPVSSWRSMTAMVGLSLLGRRRAAYLLPLLA